MKLPVSADVALVRAEIHLGGDPGDPPDAAVDLVRALARRAPVALVARLNTVRHRVVLRDADGTQLAEVVDDEVSVLDGARLAARFRELEVEFAEDAPRRARRPRSPTDCAPRARASPTRSRRSCARSAPGRSTPPISSPPPQLDFASTPLEVLRAAVARSTARLDQPRSRRRLGDDPEDVHQARVATRRLRSDLRTFGAVVDPEWDAALRDELKWLGALLGAVRDDRRAPRTARGTSPRAAARPTSTPGKRLLDGLREHRDARPHRAARRDALRPLRSRCSTAWSPRRAPSRRRATASSWSSSSATSCASRGRSCATRSTPSATSRPTRRCTRCASAPSGAGTRPRRSRRRSASRRSASPPRSRRSRTCSASTRTRSSPGSGSGATRPTAAGASSPRSSPGSSPRSKTSPPNGRASSGPTAWKQAQRATLRRWM